MDIVPDGADSTGDKTKTNKVIQVVAHEQLPAQAVRDTNNGIGTSSGERVHDASHGGGAPCYF